VYYVDLGRPTGGSIPHNYLSAQYHRIARRRGKQKAVVAVSHSVLVILYHVLREKKPYEDLGADYFATLDTSGQERHHVRQLEQLGYQVTLAPITIKWQIIFEGILAIPLLALV
jgi:hypothetical protein